MLQRLMQNFKSLVSQHCFRHGSISDYNLISSYIRYFSCIIHAGQVTLLMAPQVMGLAVASVAQIRQPGRPGTQQLWSCLFMSFFLKCFGCFFLHSIRIYNIYVLYILYVIYMYALDMEGLHLSKRIKSSIDQ